MKNVLAMASCAIFNSEIWRKLNDVPGKVPGDRIKYVNKLQEAAMENCLMRRNKSIKEDKGNIFGEEVI